MNLTMCLRKEVALRRPFLLGIIILVTGFLPHRSHRSCTAETSHREYKAISDLLRSHDDDAKTSAAAASAEETLTPMRVIGAGFGRTGTSSLVSALKVLGLKPYHFIEGVMNTPGHFELWGEISSRSADEFPLSKRDADAIIDRIGVDGFDATTDFPACLLYEEFFRRHPESLVVLSVRSTGDEWARSMMGTLGTIQQTGSFVPWRWFAGSGDPGLVHAGHRSTGG